MFIQIITLRARPEHREDFIKGIIGDAEGSVRDEPNCFRFDVTQNMHDPNLFHLICVFADEAAHHVDHMKSAHLAKFFKESKRGTPEATWRSEAILECTNVFPADDKDWKRWKP